MDSSRGDNGSLPLDNDGSDSTNKTNPRTKTESDIRCSVCSTDFSTSEHYQRHLGTKKHKRNERRLGKEMFYGENPQLSTADTFGKKLSQIGVREKYWQRNIRNYENNHTSYIWSVTAYWAASLAVNPTVKDFKISLNDKKWGDFGDAVIEIDFAGKTSATTTLAIQFKQIVSNNFRNIESLGEGSFSVVNAVSKLTNIKICEEDLETVKFIMFTTASISPALNIYNPVNIAFCRSCCKLKRRCACDVSGKADIDLKALTAEVPIYGKPFNYKRKNIIDTSDDTQSIYHFFSSDNKYVLPKIYFYTSQRRPKHFAASIDDVFYEELGGQRVQISRELTKYVENWCKGQCGGTYKLRKEDILIKLGQLFLFKFMVTPKMHPMDPQNTFDVWLEAVNGAHVTMLKDSVNISEFCGPMNVVIQKALGVQIDTTYEGVQVLRTKNLNITDNAVLRDYLAEEWPTEDGNGGNIPMEKVYWIFWKAALIPLILHVDNAKNQEYVLQVVNLLAAFGLDRRYFLKTHDIHVESSVQRFKNLSFFVTLDDVIEKLHPSLLGGVKINVTDAYSISLNDIRATDKLFQKYIYANEFFNLTVGKYVFKAHAGTFYLSKSGTEELKLVLSGDRMKCLKQEIESKIDCVLTEDGVSKSRCLRGLEPKIFG